MVHLKAENITKKYEGEKVISDISIELHEGEIVSLLGVSGGGDVRTNTIKEDNYKPNGLLDMDTNNPAVLCFA